MRTLVDSKPVVHSISECSKGDSSILHKVAYDVFGQPTSIGVLEGKWSIPVIQRDQWDDIVFNAGIDNVVVVRDRLLVHWTTTKWQDTTPGQSQGVCFDA